MPPKKPKGQKPSGKHQTKRIGVNVPEEWHAIMRQLAGKRKQPVLWYILDRVIEDAKANGVATPKPPWEEQAGQGGGS